MNPPVNRVLLVVACSAALLAAACGGGGSSSTPPGSPGGATPTPTPPSGAGPITHVVVIVQENRTVDNLFNQFNETYPGAGLDVQDYGYNSSGDLVPLVAVPFEAPYDLRHQHSSFLTEYANGKMNGWDRVGNQCGPADCARGTAFGFVPRSETQPYYQLAHAFAIADHVFQANQGPSFPAHQYLIAGQSGGFTSGYAEEDNPQVRGGNHTAGCNVPGATENTIDIASGGHGPNMFPCETYAPYTTVLEELDAADPAPQNWHYYAPSLVDIWTAPFGVATIYNKAADASKVSVPETGVLDAVKGGHLASLTYVVPCKTNSDHASSRSATGPDWVASITNAIGASSYWRSTAIVVVWDDWGGWFDHETPPIRSAYEYGFRVPMLVISPWIKRAGTVDHTPRDMTAILRFIERVFGLAPLRTLDADTDDLTTLFDFSAGRALLPYRPIDTRGFVPNNCSGALEAQPVDD